jgi:hypothetical protein
MSDFYDEHPDQVPTLIRNSRWSCLDCPEPRGDLWETVTDYCPRAHKHHQETGHRVNGQIEVRYRHESADSLARR